MRAGSAASPTITSRPRAGSITPGYVPRRPIETVLFALVRDHLESFLDHARQNYTRGIPRYVEQAFRDYLTCGVFAHGFLRLHCDDCRRDLLVAFSCQGRGICPSCAGRRMANTAAHLVDRVLPAVPVRQWVLSLPFELRHLAAFRADVARALGRIFIEAVALEQRRAAGVARALGYLHRRGVLHRAAARGPQASGRSTMKLAPVPSLLSTWTCPP